MCSVKSKDVKLKSYFFVLLAVLPFFFLFGCQDITDPNIQEEIKYLSITNSEVLKYQTGISGDEESVVITKQPQNFVISTIVRDSTTNWEAVYQYKPEGTFQGTDYVELKLGTGLGRTNAAQNITLIKLNITVN